MLNTSFLFRCGKRYKTSKMSTYIWGNTSTVFFSTLWRNIPSCWRWGASEDEWQSCFQIDREEKDKAKLGAGSVIVFDWRVQPVKLKSYNQVCDMIHHHHTTKNILNRKQAWNWTVVNFFIYTFRPYWDIPFSVETVYCLEILWKFLYIY